MVANFSWIIAGRVAGMGRPRREDIEWLADQGVAAVLSLTQGVPPGLDRFPVCHLPVPDMTSPSLDELRAAVEFIRKTAGGVLVHCGAGFGRTGTVLAAFLVSEGMTARVAIAEVRRLRPGSIETPQQEQAIEKYAELVGGAVE